MAVKRTISILSQEHSGVLEIVCIRGGPITVVEAEEMPSLLKQARDDASRSGVCCEMKLTIMTFHDFLNKYDTRLKRCARRCLHCLCARVSNGGQWFEQSAPASFERL